MRRKRRLRNTDDESAWVIGFRDSFKEYFATNQQARRDRVFYKIKGLNEKEKLLVAEAFLALSSEGEGAVREAQDTLKNAKNKEDVLHILGKYGLVGISVTKADEQDTQIKKKAKQKKQTQNKLFEDLTSSIRQITQDTSDNDVQFLLALYLLLQLSPQSLGDISDDVKEIVGEYRKSPNRGSADGKVEGVSIIHRDTLKDQKADILRIITAYETSLTRQDSEGNESQIDITDTSFFDDDDAEGDLSSAMGYKEFLEKIGILQGKMGGKNRTARQVAFFANTYYALWKTIADNESLAISVLCGKTEIPNDAWGALGTALGLRKKEDRFDGLPNQNISNDEKKAIISFLQNNPTKAQFLGLQGLSNAALAVPKGACKEARKLEPSYIRFGHVPPASYLQKMKGLSNVQRGDSQAQRAADDGALWSLFSWDTDALKSIDPKRIPNPTTTAQENDATHRLLSLERLLSEAGDDTVFDQETVEVMLDFLLTG